jgi:DNA-binding response OmpR family regulator
MLQMNTDIERNNQSIGSEPPLTKNKKNTVLVIDNDTLMLELISQVLSSHDIEVISLATSDEALLLLQKLTPGLILCDVMLDTSTIGGFSFYESIRKLKHLNKVPFIFLTGLNDRVIMRTGKEMGVDDYLTKPITEEDLVAIIKGKLKRFAML